jgi:hypothetical protein
VSKSTDQGAGVGGTAGSISLQGVPSGVSGGATANGGASGSAVLAGARAASGGSSVGAAGTEPNVGGAGHAGAAGNAGASNAGAGGGASGGAGAGTAGGAGTSMHHTPIPSAGCGKAGRPSGGVVTVSGSHIYSFPASYDGNTPVPLIMAFHAAGNRNDQLRNITKGSPIEQHFVMAFPKSAGNGWSLGDSSSIDARYDELVQNYCIDTSRVFATGHSSGAQLIVQFMCRGDDRYAAIAPVASSAYCMSWRKPLPALIIHGSDDHERANTNQDADGTKDLAPYLSSNHCATSTIPHEQTGCSSMGVQVDPGCVEYQGCSAPTIWCHHNDPQYSGTNHGWPCFANAAIDAFFTGQL